jgi:hypothetical protein
VVAKHGIRSFKMQLKEGQKFADKHGAGVRVNELIKEKVISQAKNNELACAKAFKIADELNVSAAEVGKTADLLEMKLAKCQLGLFGYKPEKKIVKPKGALNPKLESAVQDSLVEGALSCARAWEIARDFDIPKMAVSAVCERLKIKIRHCQLGAF